MRLPSAAGTIYRLKVTLRHSRPPIWRRFLVPAGVSLEQLHEVLQAVMGWTNSHLHQFEAGGVRYGTSDPHFDLSRVSESRTTLDQILLQQEDRLVYEYDFGDSWEHDIILEAVLPPDPDSAYPVIEAGRRACPPEDVGGIPGYEEFLEAIKDPEHPAHQEKIEWIGGAFDPDAFSVRDANRAARGE